MHDSINSNLRFNTPENLIKSFPKTLQSPKTLEYIKNEIYKPKTPILDEFISQNPKISFTYDPSIEEIDPRVTLNIQHNEDIELIRNLLKQKQSSQQIYDKTVQGIWKILYSHGNVEDFIENPVWSISSDALYYENRNFKKIIENLKNRAHSFTTRDDLINHFNELTEQADWLTLDFIKHEGKIKYKIEFPDNIKRFVVKYDGNKRKQYTTKKIEFPKEIDLNIQLKTVNQDILNKIPVSEHIKRLSTPIIDYIEKGKYITNTESPISEQHI